MALFPRVQSPCPFTGDLSAIMDGDVCRLCKRQVFDLTAMSDDARVAFMQSCTEEVCVSYKIPMLAAAAVAMATMTMPTALAACEPTETIVVVGGGIKDPANVQYVQVPVDPPVPQLPVVYEKAPAPAQVSSKAPA